MSFWNEGTLHGEQKREEPGKRKSESGKRMCREKKSSPAQSLVLRGERRTGEKRWLGKWRRPSTVEGAATLEIRKWWGLRHVLLYSEACEFICPRILLTRKGFLSSLQ